MRGAGRVKSRLGQLLAASMVATVAMVSPSSPAVGTPPADAGAPEAVPGELLVGYDPGATEADRARARGRSEAALQERVVPAQGATGEVQLVRLPPGKERAAAVRELESDPAVAYAEPNWIYAHAATSDPSYTNGSLWGMYGDATSPANQYGSQAGEAWAAGNTGSAGVYVGVIDEGIQHTHPDLNGQLNNPGDPPGNGDEDANGLVDDTYGWDFVNNDNTIYDGGTKGNLDDHGTHVAGTIGAKANNGEGVVGVNWNVTLISGKFLGSRGGTLANAIKAVDYFTDLKTRRGLNIVATNNSWGGGGFSQGLFDAITRANTAGILFIAAAGNSGTNNDTTASYPSNYNVDNVIAVAAIDDSGGLASFSQYGAETVDLGASGVGILSTTAYNSYSSYNGTSMATPHVTGAAALYKAVNPGASAADIKNAILLSTVPTAPLSGKTVTGGRLNVAGLVGSDSATPPPVETSPPPETTPDHSVTVAAGTKKKNNTTEVTVTWVGFTTGTSVDVTRNGTTFSTANDGSLIENWRGSGTVTYRVCEAGSTTACASDSTII